MIPSSVTHVIIFYASLRYLWRPRRRMVVEAQGTVSELACKTKLWARSYIWGGTRSFRMLIFTDLGLTRTGARTSFERNPPLAAKTGRMEQEMTVAVLFFLMIPPEIPAGENPSFQAVEHRWIRWG